MYNQNKIGIRRMLGLDSEMFAACEEDFPIPVAVVELMERAEALLGRLIPKQQEFAWTDLIILLAAGGVSPPTAEDAAAFTAEAAERKATREVQEARVKAQAEADAAALIAPPAPASVPPPVVPASSAPVVTPPPATNVPSTPPVPAEAVVEG